MTITLHDEVNGNSKLVDSHCNHEHGAGELWQGYTEGCIKLSLTLIRHIMYSHDIEMTSLNEKKAFLFQKGLTTELYSLPYKSKTLDKSKPWCSYLLDGMRKQLGSLYDQKARYSILRNDIKGIVKI